MTLYHSSLEIQLLTETSGPYSKVSDILIKFPFYRKGWGLLAMTTETKEWMRARKKGKEVLYMRHDIGLKSSSSGIKH